MIVSYFRDALVLGFDLFLKMARARFFQSIAAKNDVLITERLFDKLYRLPLAVLESRELWHWQSLFQDAALIRNVLSGATAALVIDLPFSILFLFIVLLIAPPLGWVIATSLLLFLILAIAAERMIHARALSERGQSQRRDTLLTDLIVRRDTVKLLAASEQWRKKWSGMNEQVINASMDRGRITDNYRILSQSMTLVFTVTITTVGALAILEQNLTIGALIAANMLGSRMIAPMVQMVEHWRIITQFRQAVSRLEGFHALTEDHSDKRIDLPVKKGQYTLRDVHFSYPQGSDEVIRGLDGNIGPAGLHVLMGRNGSGKSTLLKLLSGFYVPVDGKLLVDDADLRQFTPAQLHQRIGYLPQNPELFQGTIHENIAIAREDVSDEMVIDAARDAQLHPLVVKMPDGYQTNVREDNRGLSGGVVQRIALARTLLNRSAVLLLDEPTNNLDRESEVALVEVLKSYAAKHTVIVATHSPAFLSAADTILVLDSGKVAMAGAAGAVLERMDGLRPAPVKPQATGQ
jgi:ABC-type bacteriocin/lantibiotic exporter with double-glycine peptidase domain